MAVEDAGRFLIHTNNLSERGFCWIDESVVSGGRRRGDMVF
jgi:hypothetical protein